MFHRWGTRCIQKVGEPQDEMNLGNKERRSVGMRNAGLASGPGGQPRDGGKI
ncbi:hypothetical protein E4U43_007444 [Claviceps pusilla]|uniref:Uncharacterized protein n=1 Tax=Claviceps pusilla TaxID=123648 RepID=A0A9P7T1K4_9HYPO|nr:hypothetical protein E4U43_007444 [Claviceps pusilla]